MKRILITILLLVTLAPLPVLAFSNSNLSVPTVSASFAELQQKHQLDIPLKFTLTAPANELSEVKMVKLSVENTCPGQGAFNVMEGDFRPVADDYQDGKIEGTLMYNARWTDTYHSCQGKHDIKLYFCRAVDSRCTWASTSQYRITALEVPEAIVLNGTTPSASSSASAGPSTSAPPSDGGGGYNPLLPGSGRFGSLWEVLIRVVQALLALASVVAIAAIIIGGYQYMTSQGSPDKTQVAKATITYAIIGLVLVMTFYLIMRFLLPILGVSRDIIWF